MNNCSSVQIFALFKIGCDLFFEKFSWESEKSDLKIRDFHIKKHAF